MVLRKNLLSVLATGLVVTTMGAIALAGEPSGFAGVQPPYFNTCSGGGCDWSKGFQQVKYHGVAEKGHL